MNSSFPNRWSFSYLKFTKYVTNIIVFHAVSVHDHNTRLLPYHPQPRSILQQKQIEFWKFLCCYSLISMRRIIKDWFTFFFSVSITETDVGWKFGSFNITTEHKRFTFVRDKVELEHNSIYILMCATKYLNRLTTMHANTYSSCFSILIAYKFMFALLNLYIPTYF